MELRPHDEPDAFCSQGTNDAHSTAACCSRRRFLGGLAGVGAGAAFTGRQARAQGTAVAEKPFRIDIHHHLASPGFIAEIAGRRTGQVPLMKWTVAQSIEDMDQGGVATSILSISEPRVFFGNFDAARRLARETNEFGARLIADHPGRFGMFATVPLPDVEGCPARDRIRARYAEDGRHLHDDRLPGKIPRRSPHSGRCWRSSIDARRWCIRIRSGTSAAAIWCRTCSSR